VALGWNRSLIEFTNTVRGVRVTEEFITRVFDVMQATPQHTYQVLTKRSRRLAELAPRLPWPTNIWIGTSIETERYSYRADHLREDVPLAVELGDGLHC
jgi:protein gp37